MQPGSFFEYRVWDPNLYKEIRPWTRGEYIPFLAPNECSLLNHYCLSNYHLPAVTHKTSVSWLDWRMGGPGNGRYFTVSVPVFFSTTPARFRPR